MGGRFGFWWPIICDAGLRGQTWSSLFVVSYILVLYLHGRNLMEMGSHFGILHRTRQCASAVDLHLAIIHGIHRFILYFLLRSHRVALDLCFAAFCISRAFQESDVRVGSLRCFS